MTTQANHAASVTLIEQAETELAAGDVRQASEKGWGAAAQIVKAVAQQRDLPHHNHAALYRVVDQLATETGDDDIYLLFQVANQLHVNFYENWNSSENVSRALTAVHRFVEKLSPLL